MLSPGLSIPKKYVGTFQLYKKPFAKDFDLTKMV